MHVISDRGCSGVGIFMDNAMGFGLRIVVYCILCIVGCGLIAMFTNIFQTHKFPKVAGFVRDKVRHRQQSTRSHESTPYGVARPNKHNAPGGARSPTDVAYGDSYPLSCNKH